MTRGKPRPYGPKKANLISITIDLGLDVVPDINELTYDYCEKQSRERIITKKNYPK